METQNKTLETVRILTEAGVTVALTTDHPVLNVYQLLHAAAAVVRETGMDEYDVLRLITVNAAKILGVGDRVGSIEKGKDADLVIIDGHPFDYLSQVAYTIIDGRVVYPKPSPNSIAAVPSAERTVAFFSCGNAAGGAYPGDNQADFRLAGLNI